MRYFCPKECRRWPDAPRSPGHEVKNGFFLENLHPADAPLPASDEVLLLVWFHPCLTFQLRLPLQSNVFLEQPQAPVTESQFENGFSRLHFCPNCGQYLHQCLFLIKTPDIIWCFPSVWPRVVWHWKRMGQITQRRTVLTAPASRPEGREEVMEISWPKFLLSPKFCGKNNIYIYVCM